MRNESLWRPSKFAVKNGVVVPSPDRGQLAPSSRLSAAHVADFYNETIPDLAFGTLLDLGCGKQPLYGIYRSKASRVVAADWPLSLHESRHVDVHCDLTRPLPFPDEAFDTVLCSDVLEHLPEPHVLFREMSRVLRPGGVLLLNTPFLYPVHEAPHDYLRHTRFSLVRLTVAAGLEVEALQHLGGALDVLVDMVGKLLGKVPLVGPRLAGGLQGLAIRARRTSWWRMSWRMTRDYFPLGHGLVARKPPL